MSGKSYIIDSLKYSSLSTLQATIVKNSKSEAEAIINKVRCCVQINSAKHIATEFIKSATIRLSND